MSLLFNWWDYRDTWIHSGREAAGSELALLLGRIRQTTLIAAGQAIDQAIQRAWQMRADLPWYFTSQERFIRWVTITALRAEIGAPIPIRVPIPMLGELEDPYRSVLLYYSCDEFRLAFDLPYVFRTTRDEATETFA